MLRIVRTENGLVKGIPAADPRVTAFKGIPFAAPPVGELRWRAPQPAADWEGVRECFTFAPINMQEIPGTDPDNIYTREWHVDPEIPMSEDSLYLNVWTNAKTGDEKMPVMVWIFGGGYQCGYTAEMEFDGERIARRGVILVSVQYRVGVLGFLSHPLLHEEDPEAPQGNYGLMDQLAGLQWVKRNIAAFGGDPGNITVFGQSAGAGSVLSLVCSPYTVGKDLIHRAIFESGGGLRSYGQGGGVIPLQDALENGKRFFEKNHFGSLEEARSVPAREIFDMGRSMGSMKCWAPTVDGNFLTEDPSDSMAAGRYPDISYLFGCTSREGDPGKGSPKTLAELREYAEARYGEKAPEFLALCQASTDEEVKALSSSDDAFRGRFMNNILFLKQRLDAGKKQNYMYVFDASIPGFDDPGTFHSSELWFVFESLAKCWRPFKGAHYDLARKMCNYWTNFARTGDPNGSDTDGTPMEEWRSASPEDRFIICFNEQEISDYQQRAYTPLVNFRIDRTWELLREKKLIP